MRRTVLTVLALVIGLAVTMPPPADGQTPPVSAPSKPRRALRITLGALAGAGLGALWIVKLCPNGSDSPMACIGPPAAFIVGGAWAGYKLERNVSQPIPSGSRDRFAGERFAGPVALQIPRLRVASRHSEDTSTAPQLDVFEALKPILTVGQEVKVAHHAGRSIRGKVVSISDTELVVSRQQNPFPSFRPRKEETLVRDTVRRVDLVDSTWNGGLIGAAAAVGVQAAAIAAECSSGCDDNFGRAGRFVIYSGLFVPLGIGIGRQFDSLMNETVYERPAGAVRVTVSPSVGKGFAGFLAEVRF